MDDVMGGWLSFDLAAEEVERRLGTTWGKAQKTVLDLCEKGTVRWKNQPTGGPNVSVRDFEDWLEKKLSRKPRGKQARIRAQLIKMYPAARVPDPDQCPRDALRADLLKRDKTLDPLDPATLKKAIDEHNGAIRINLNQMVSH